MKNALLIFTACLGFFGFGLISLAIILVISYMGCKNYKCQYSYIDCGDLPQFCTNCTTCYGSNECFPYKECKFETNKFLIFLFVGIFSCCLGSCLALNFGEQQRQEKLKEKYYQKIIMRYYIIILKYYQIILILRYLILNLKFLFI